MVYTTKPYPGLHSMKQLGVLISGPSMTGCQSFAGLLLVVFCLCTIIYSWVGRDDVDIEILNSTTDHYRPLPHYASQNKQIKAKPF